MVEQIGKRKPRFVPRGVQPVIELFTECRVKRAVDEVVGLFHPDLSTGFREILHPQSRARGRWPVSQFHIQELRRPATPGQRTAANSEDEPKIIEYRMVYPRHAKVRRATHIRHILDVLRQYKRPC